MTTGATGQLGLALPVQGELSGTWGDTVNNGITQYTNIAIAATLTLTNDGAVTLANTTGDASASNITSSLTGAGTVTAQFAIVKVTGTLTTAKVITAPSYSKTYVVVNAATGSTVTFKASGQTGVSIAVGESAWVYYNGTDYVKIVGTATAGAAGGSTTQVQYNSSGSLAGSANLTFDGTSLTLGGNPTLSAGTANGVTYLNGSKVLTSGSALTFDGTNLGIGTASPAYPLDILSNSNSTQRIQFKNSNAGSSAVSMVQIANDAGNALQVYQQSEAGGGGSVVQANGTGSLTLRTLPNQPVIFGVNNSEQMRLTSTGLGIGTSSPSTKLHVYASSPTVFVEGTGTSDAGVQTKTSLANFKFGAGIGSSTNCWNVYDLTAGAERLRIDSSGNLGLGVTPSAWISGYNALDVGSVSSFLSTGVVTWVGSNWYVKNTGVDTYKTSNYALRYGQSVTTGQHQWYTAASGTAGNAITFTQAMTLDASGNLGVGTTSPSTYGTFAVKTSLGSISIASGGSVGARLKFYDSSNTQTAEIINNGGSNELLQISATASTGAILFNTNSAERARIDSSGNLLVGTTATAAAKLTIVSTTNPALTLPNIAEIATVSATAATGTINYDLTTQSVLYYTTNASANFTMNVRGNSGLSLNSMLSTGQSVTMAFLCTNGSTAYYQSAMTIDGTSVTPKWQGGTAPTTGNASSIDSYVYTIIKTASATYTVLASQTKFA